jgi:ubiquinone/menaquinone biosynthesis C-methylase UbiE
MENYLDETVPELTSYLSRGLNVLDVGCGPGSLTVDVAKAVLPGEVVGVDQMQTKIDAARQLAEEWNVINARFRVGDIYNLDCSSDTFDVVFSHNVLHQLIDPVKALSEQRRVAKPGGWVIAAGVRDLGLSPRYPECPMIEKALSGLTQFFQLYQRRYEAGEHGPTSTLLETDYFDAHAGRRCPEWFSEAGLTHMDIQVRVFRMEHPGAENMKIQNIDWLPAMDDAESPFQKAYARVFEEGLLDEDTLARARQELMAWYKHPHAFHFHTYVFAAGKA